MTNIHPQDDSVKEARLTTLLSYQAGAWGEISARIGARQTTQIAFVSMVITLGSTSIGVYNEIVGDISNQDKFLIVLSIIGVALSWVFNAWVQHNEGILGLLTKFNRSTEEKIAELIGSEGVGWFASDLINESLEHRKLSDYVMVVAHIATLLPSVLSIANLTFNSPYPTSSPEDILLFLVHLMLLLLGAIPIWKSLITKELRKIVGKKESFMKNDQSSNKKLRSNDQSFSKELTTTEETEA